MYLFIVIGVVAALIVIEEMCFGWIHRTILLAVNFRAFSTRSPRIGARLEAAKQAVSDAYAARDAARHQTGEEGLGYFLAQNRLNTAWERLTYLGGVAFFCGVPAASRTLRMKNGRHRLEVTFCFVAMLFAANLAHAAPPLTDAEVEAIQLSAKAQLGRQYLTLLRRETISTTKREEVLSMLVNIFWSLGGNSPDENKYLGAAKRLGLTSFELRHIEEVAAAKDGHPKRCR